jgi:hypothetical protein
VSMKSGLTEPRKWQHSKVKTSFATPEHAVADFCLIPIGTPTASVSKEIASVQRLLKDCGLDHSMHSAGTTVGRSL